MIRFRLWKSNNPHSAQAQPTQARGGLSIHQKLGSTLGRSYRFVANRLAVLRHLHPAIKAKGEYEH